MKKYLSSPFVSLRNPASFPSRAEESWVSVSSFPAADLNVIGMDPDAVAKAFVDHYYSTFDANRAGLGNLYQDNSMLTFEGQKIQGSPNIVAKLSSLPFQQCKHSVSTVDCQPSGPTGGMLVFVSGNLQLAGEQHALKFSQMFHLMPTPQGSFFVQNDIFRLNYA